MWRLSGEGRTSNILYFSALWPPRNQYLRIFLIKTYLHHLIDIFPLLINPHPKLIRLMLAYLSEWYSYLIYPPSPSCTAPAHAGIKVEFAHRSINSHTQSTRVYLRSIETHARNSNSLSRDERIRLYDFSVEDWRYLANLWLNGLRVRRRCHFREEEEFLSKLESSCPLIRNA